MTAQLAIIAAILAIVVWAGYRVVRIIRQAQDSKRWRDWWANQKKARERREKVVRRGKPSHRELRDE
jgi:hypothetical protein